MAGRRWMVAMVLVGCGPAVAIDDGSSSSGGEPQPTTNEPVTETGFPGTSAPPDPSTFTASDTATDGPVDETGRDETGITFIDGGPDLGEWIDCSLWEDDCPRGTKCMPWANDGGSSWNATKCAPLSDDPQDVGDACTVEGNGVSGIDDCEAHAMCFYVDPETNTGTCIAFCIGEEANPLCEDEGSNCTINGEGTLILCMPICHPLEDDCPAGQACYPSSDTFACVPDAGGGQGAAGDSCEFVNVCDPGLFCATAERMPECEGTTGCCSPFCELGDPSPCAVLGGAVECEPWYESGEAPPGFETLGACLLPI